MSNPAPPYLVEKPTSEICVPIPLGDAAKALVSDGLAPREYLDLLLEKKLFLDAIRFWANALPKREGVWWACLCSRMIARDDAPEAETKALEAAEAWAVSPTEENRRAAMPAAEAAGFATPAGCAALSAFWSGGSLAPPNVPAVPPPDHLTAHGVASAVMFAAVVTEPETAEQKYQMFFEQGLGVAEGQLRWREAPPQISSPPPMAPAPASRPAKGGPRPLIDWG